jgi:hypothetical protein
MTWKPGFDFNAAMTLADRIEEDAANSGSLITPALKWRIIQLAAEALENARTMGKESVGGLPTVTYTNGVAGVSSGKAMGTPEVSDMWGNADSPWGGSGTATNDPALQDPVMLTMEQIDAIEGKGPPLEPHTPPSDWTPFDPPKSKRSRGRPKGAKNKKKKAKAQAAPTPELPS